MSNLSKCRAIIGKHAASVDTQVLERIRANALEWIFTPVDFADLGSRAAVASALKRHKAAGTIRQYARGLYGVPRKHELLGELLPGIDAVIAALERRDGVRFHPAGAYTANMLGLSEQVPANERRGLVKDIALAPAWMRPYFIDLAKEEQPTATAKLQAPKARKAAIRA